MNNINPSPFLFRVLLASSQGMSPSLCLTEREVEFFPGYGVFSALGKKRLIASQHM